MVVPATADPLGSWTIPETDAVSFWAHAAVHRKIAAIDEQSVLGYIGAPSLRGNLAEPEDEGMTNGFRIGDSDLSDRRMMIGGYWADGFGRASLGISFSISGGMANSRRT